MRRGNVVVLVIVLVVTLLGLLGFVWQKGYFNAKSKPEAVVTSEAKNTVSPLPPQSPVANNPTKIDDLIDYKIPDGWKKISSDEEFVVIQSPDYKDKSGPGYVDLDGMQIRIRRSVNKNNLYNFENLPVGGPGGDGTTEKKIMTKVAGLDAETFHLNVEAHVLYYGLFKNNYVWEISFYSHDLNTENTFRKVIDDFIASVKFK